MVGGLLSSWWVVFYALHSLYTYWEAYSVIDRIVTLVGWSTVVAWSPFVSVAEWVSVDTAVPAEGNGDLQTLICVLVARPRWCPTLSNPVPWQNSMAAYLGYTLRMRTLFRGWPVMVNDTHTRRRRSVAKPVHQRLIITIIIIPRNLPPPLPDKNYPPHEIMLAAVATTTPVPRMFRYL